MQTIGELSPTPLPATILPLCPTSLRKSGTAGTLAGVSGWLLQFEAVLSLPLVTNRCTCGWTQLHSRQILLIYRGWIVSGKCGFIQKDEFKKAGYETNPLEDEDFRKISAYRTDLTTLTKDALAESPLNPSDKARCKNFFALGFMCYVYGRPLEPTLTFFDQKWGKRLPDVAEANSTALKAGHNLGDTMETARNRYQLAKQRSSLVCTGKSQETKQQYMAWLRVHSVQSWTLYSGYPITPASPVWKDYPPSKNMASKPYRQRMRSQLWEWQSGQALPEIYLWLRQGPGMCLKSEFIGFASITELPVVICNVQRWSKHRLTHQDWTKWFTTEFIFRHSDCPLPVIAAYHHQTALIVQSKHAALH